MKNCAIRISDVENGYVVTIQRFAPVKAEGELGLAGFVKGHAAEGVQRDLVCKSWGEVLSVLAALAEVPA